MLCETGSRFLGAPLEKRRGPKTANSTGREGLRASIKGTRSPLWWWSKGAYQQGAKSALAVVRCRNIAAKGVHVQQSAPIVALLACLRRSSVPLCCNAPCLCAAMLRAFVLHWLRV